MRRSQGGKVPQGPLLWATRSWGPKQEVKAEGPERPGGGILGLGPEKPSQRWLCSSRGESPGAGGRQGVKAGGDPRSRQGQLGLGRGVPHSGRQESPGPWVGEACRAALSSPAPVPPVLGH